MPTSEIDRANLVERTRDLSPMCPLFEGSTVVYHPRCGIRLIPSYQAPPSSTGMYHNVPLLRSTFFSHWNVPLTTLDPSPSLSHWNVQLTTLDPSPSLSHWNVLLSMLDTSPSHRNVPLTTLDTSPSHWTVPLTTLNPNLDLCCGSTS